MKTGLTYISNVRWGVNGPRVGEPKSDVCLYMWKSKYDELSDGETKSVNAFLLFRVR